MSKHHTRFQKKMEDMRRIHDGIVEMIYNNPELISIDGSHIDPNAIKSKEREIWLGNESRGYKADLALIREIENHAAEVDVIEAFFSGIGFAIRDARIQIRKRLLPYCKIDRSDFIHQLEREMNFRPGRYRELWIDIIFAFPDYYTKNLKFERLLGYDRERVAKFRY